MFCSKPVVPFPCWYTEQCHFSLRLCIQARQRAEKEQRHQILFILSMLLRFVPVSCQAFSINIRNQNPEGLTQPAVRLNET